MIENFFSVSLEASIAGSLKTGLFDYDSNLNIEVHPKRKLGLLSFKQVKKQIKLFHQFLKEIQNLSLINFHESASLVIFKLEFADGVQVELKFILGSKSLKMS